MTSRCHCRDQCVDVGNGVDVSFSPILLVPHRDDLTLKGVNLSLYVRAPNILKYPELRLQLILLDKPSYLRNRHTLIDLTIHLKVQELTTLHNPLPQWQQQHITTNHLVDLFNILRSRLEIKVQIEVLDKLGERV